MIVEMKHDPPETPAPGRRAGESPALKPSPTPDDSRIDAMSDGSFPASDPPAVWTWEVKTRADTPELPAKG
jgi:hypothetical protein